MGKPGPKPRPALVTGVGVLDDGTPAARVAYGTSEKTRQPYSGEFMISPEDGAAYLAAGLAFPTKFNLRSQVELPYTDEWFKVPNAPQSGQTPKLGILHPGLVRRAQAAFNATFSPESK